MENHYVVKWEIDIWAGSPEDAARYAMEIQEDPENIAHVYEVTDDEGNKTEWDLDEMAGRV